MDKTPEFMLWVDELIQQYSDEIKQLQVYRETIDQKHIQGRNEAEIVSGMVSEMRYALYWMRIGRRPGSRRGIEIKKVYNRSLFAKLVQAQMPDITDGEKRIMVDALFRLSKQERRCFIMHMAYGLTLEEIAGMIGLSKGSVQSFVNRAKRKLHDWQV